MLGTQPVALRPGRNGLPQALRALPPVWKGQELNVAPGFSPASSLFPFLVARPAGRRIVIDREFLDKTSRCCGFYHYTGKLSRHGLDGNPIIWMNIAQSGITLRGENGKLIAPHVSDQCLNDALLLELNYLKESLAANAGDPSGKAFVYNAYAVLTACRILYSAYHRALVSKDQAYAWAMETVPPMWRSVIHVAKENRLKNAGSTTPPLEQDAQRFVEFVTAEVNRILQR
jgi:hypothetical protein